MNRSMVEPALTGLIPTLNGPLPPELVDLAVSLLSRSRSVANSLKPDEEIARPYACAQLACERLKKKLNLPTITPRPPCPPRIYKKLYNYLESALPASSREQEREPQTPRKLRRGEADAEGDATGAQSERNTPRTPKTPMSSRRTPRSRRGDINAARHAGPPEWIMPAVRELVKEFAYPAAAPHVFAGVESIFPLLERMAAAAAAAAAAPETPNKRPRRSSVAAAPPPINAEVSDTQILALIAVVLFYVLSRMMDTDITPTQYAEWRQKAVHTLLASVAAKQKANEKDMSEGELIRDIEELMPMAQTEGWLTMDWFLNVGLEDEGDAMEGVEMGDDAVANGGDKGKGTRKRTLKERLGSEYIGLGTMMQDANDYLGERQMEEYKRWEAGILKRLEEIEAS